MPSDRKRGPARSHTPSRTTPFSTPSQKRRRKFSPREMSAAVSTSNTYGMLNPNENISDSESMISEEKLTKTPKAANLQKSSQKPPPLNIVGVEYAKVTQMLAPLKQKADDFSVSLAPFGIRVYSANVDRYKTLKDELEKLNFKYFTYQLREEQTTKIVLHGLYDMPVEELNEYLVDADIKPVKIKKMNIHQKKFSDHCLYLLYFPKSDKVKISNLREIPAINSVKVRWQYYSNNRVGPMQCSNCMLYGHGGMNCRLDPVCVRCAGSHKSKECPKLQAQDSATVLDRIPDDQVKCALCGQNHTANYSRCEKRIEFLERQERYRRRTQRQNQVQTFVEAPQLNDFNFPRVDPRQRAERFPQNPQGGPINNDLFTSAELMPIFRELMTALSQARNKMEQISVLGEIAIKYCCR